VLSCTNRSFTMIANMLLGAVLSTAALAATPGPTPGFDPAPPYADCPAQGVAQNELPCPGQPGDVPLENKTGVRVLPLPGLKPDPAACPQNAEGKPELLGLHDVTPVENFYVRNHGAIPQRALAQSLAGWQLQVDGFVQRPRNFTMAQLKAEFPHYSRQYVLECAGNGRHGYRPGNQKQGGPASGNQWTIGAAANGNWTGVLLRDVLLSVGLQDAASYLAWYAEDKDCGGTDADLISRGFDLEKAMDDGTMLVFEMNGVPLPSYHGFPLRVFAPGYPGAAQGKWLTRLWVRDQVHDGAKMTGWAYRMPTLPLFAGGANTSVPPDAYAPPIETEIITKLGVRAIITAPPRCHHQDGRTVAVEGRAWSGAGDVVRVEVSVDHGMTWSDADALARPVNKWAWQKWSKTVVLPSAGAFRVMARATDVEGRVQPIITPGWNPKGYMSNAVMNVDIAVTVKK